MMAIRTAKSHARQFSKFTPLRQWHTEHTGSAHSRHRADPGAAVRFLHAAHIGRSHARLLAMISSIRAVIARLNKIGRRLQKRSSSLTRRKGAEILHDARALPVAG